MKHPIIKTSIYFLLGLFFLVSCAGSGSTETHKGKEYTSQYICPMHCEGSGDETAGKCPDCGMDYVENKSATDSSTSYIHSKSTSSMCWKPKK